MERHTKAARGADAADAQLIAAVFTAAICACGAMTRTTHLFRS
ncbi:alkylhydroperoxidase [Cupriavidus sp. SK-4]|nr:hypothetical protein [Cupriavidus sp. SK-4]EYS85646.1 alkylhydroperoxidase [Cupriavidus sp. SK-4]